MLDLGQLNNDIKALDAGDETSRQAILSLKHVEAGEWTTVPLKVVQPLLKLLQTQLRTETKQPSVRQDVVTIIGNIGPRSEPAVPQLIELLAEGVADGIRGAAATALGKIGKEAKAAVDKLIEVLSNRRITLVVHAVRALGDIGCADQRVRTALGNLWLSPSQSQTIQTQVAIALCKLHIDAHNLLVFLTASLVKNQDVSLRKLAAEALAWCGKNELDVVPALLTAALYDKDEEVRRVAKVGLDQMKLTPEKAIYLCSKQLKDSSYAEMALRKSGQLAVPGLIEALKMDDISTREKAIRTLGSLGELAVEAVPELTKSLNDKNLDVRLAAAKSMWNITKKPEVAVPVLVDLLEEKWSAAQEASEPRRRFLQTVLEALQRIGPPAKAAIPALNQKTKDKNRLISESAQSALKEISANVPIKVAPSK
jgi:HEAT repeat protein